MEAETELKTEMLRVDALVVDGDDDFWLEFEIAVPEIIVPVSDDIIKSFFSRITAPLGFEIDLEDHPRAGRALAVVSVEGEEIRWRNYRAHFRAFPENAPLADRVVRSLEASTRSWERYFGETEGSWTRGDPLSRIALKSLMTADGSFARALTKAIVRIIWRDRRVVTTYQCMIAIGMPS